MAVPPWDIFEAAVPGRDVDEPPAWVQQPWYTWTAPARAVVHAFAARVPRLPEPARLRVPGQGLYSVSYHLGACDALDAALERDLTLLAWSLRRFSLPRTGLLLLSGLCDERIDGRVIHALFARLRDIMVHDAPDSMALHAPIEACPVLRSFFPLHADLFPASRLLTVFDNVAADETGASLLLSLDAFERVLQQLSAIPEAVRARVRQIREDRSTEYYDDFIDLLYRPDRPWRAPLLEALAGVQHRIKLGPGQGYLLDDRAWLHGRDMQKHPVTTDRLHRLVFAPATG